MSLDVSFFRVFIAGFLLAHSVCQDNNTVISSSPDATSTTPMSLTTLLNHSPVGEITTSRSFISAEPEFNIGSDPSNNEPAVSTTLITQPPTAASATVESITSTPSAAMKSTTIYDISTTQMRITEQHVHNSTSESTVFTTAQVTSAPSLTSTHSTTSTAGSTGAPVTTQQGTTMCITVTQPETTNKSTPSTVLTNQEISDAVEQPSSQHASALTTFGTSTSASTGNIAPSSSSSSGTRLSQRDSTLHTTVSLETSSMSSTSTSESELQEQHTSSFKISTITPTSSINPENTTISDPITFVTVDYTEEYENRTESPSENEKEVYLSMYARNVTLIVVIMVILNIMSLSIAIFIFSRIAKRNHRWDRPPSRCGSKRQYFLSNPPPPSAVACTLISGRNLANDAECQDGESTRRESVPVVTTDSGWCVPLSEEMKKVDQDQKLEEDTGV